MFVTLTSTLEFLHLFYCRLCNVNGHHKFVTPTSTVEFLHLCIVDCVISADTTSL